MSKSPKRKPKPVQGRRAPSLRRNINEATRSRLLELMEDVRTLEGMLTGGDPTPDLVEIHLNYRAAAAALLNVVAITEGEDRLADLLA